MKKINKISLIVISVLLLSPINIFALTKSETVHVSLDYTGKVTNTIVNTKLTKLNSGDVTDYTYLTNIENLNGDEKLSLENEKLTFKSNGKDLVYQGKINNELPIKIKTKYYLDGKEVNPKDIINKKGTIRIEYALENTSYDYSSGMHTPFVVSNILLLDTNNTSNVSVNTGKVVSTGSNNIVVGLASPGLYDDLGLSELSDMDKIIISYDTTKFSLNDCYFAMTPKLLEDIDVSRLNRVDELNSSLNTLQNGMNKLESGSKELSTGASKIDNGMESLSTGIEQALKGSETITEGLNQVVLGSSKLESLTTLIDSLYSTYNDNNKLIETISSGQAKAQYEQGINDATLKKTELENTLSQVNAGISQLEQGEALGVLTEEQKAQLATLRGQRTQLEAGIEQYAQGISKAESELAQLPLNAAKLEGANEAIAKIIMGLLGTTNPSDINETNINNFKSQLTALVGGISSLKDGSKELTTGLDRLNNGSKELANGTSSLKEGSKELANGIIKINNEGIKKLSDYGSKLTNYSHKVKTLIKLSKDYNGFASDNSDNTIFIYKLSK